MENRIKEDFVIKSYDKLATEIDKIYRSNSYKWNTYKKFINSLPPNADVLDVGCGNGKNMFLRDDLNMVGCDISLKLLEICRKIGLNVVYGDATNLPFEDSSFDAVMSVWVLHHIPSESDRVKAVDEMLRVLKPNGRVFIQVRGEHSNKSKNFKSLDKEGDYILTYDKGDEKIGRYFHLYNFKEIDALIIKLRNRGDLKKIYKYTENDNWIIFLDKC